MSKDTDVFADNTVAGNEKRDTQRGEKDKYGPGDKIFKEKGNPSRPGYTNIPGAGPNPDK